MSLSRKPLGTYALEGARYVNAFRIYSTSSRPPTLIDINTVFISRSRVSVRTQTGVTSVSVDAGSGCGAGVRLAFVNVWRVYSISIIIKFHYCRLDYGDVIFLVCFFWFELVKFCINV